IPVFRGAVLGGGRAMQSDDLFVRKIRRHSARPPLASISFDAKGLPAPLLRPPRSEVTQGLSRGHGTPPGLALRPASHIMHRRASAASAGPAPTPVPEEPDPGDGKDGPLVLSCPHFRNEIGGEEEGGLGQRQEAGGGAGQLPNAAVSVLEEPRESYPTRGSRTTHCIEYADLGASYYRKYFYGKEHQNFFGVDERLGAVAVSLRREEKEKEGASLQYNYRLILRTSELRTLRGSVLEEALPPTARSPAARGLSPKKLLEHVLPDLNLQGLRLASNSPKVPETLLKLDEQGVSFQRKVGVLYCRAGQGSEEEMYNNEGAGPPFQEFLELLGQHIQLRGFTKYRAQLDTKTDSTGTHSLYTTYQDYEIMFHVSTMLPYTPNNRQQLLRKRHIGNDIVTIIFQEPGAQPFTPRTIRSHFQHVFIIVRAHEPCTERTTYSVAVSRTKDIPLFGPPIPAGHRFPRTPVFRDFLLAKAINAENAAERSGKFHAMATRTRQEYLQDLARSHATTTRDEVKDIVNRLQLVTRGCETRELTLLRNGLGQLGFQVDSEGFVTDVERFTFAEKAGLQPGARLVRVCERALPGLSHAQTTELLRTAKKVTITMVPPDENGKPRRSFSELYVKSLQEKRRSDSPAREPLQMAGGPGPEGELRPATLQLLRSLSLQDGPPHSLAEERTEFLRSHSEGTLRGLGSGSKGPCFRQLLGSLPSFMPFFLLPCLPLPSAVLSEAGESLEEEWDSISNLATTCNSILEALSKEGEQQIPRGHRSRSLSEKVSHLESMLKKLQEDLQQEQAAKAALQAEVQSLRQNNQRLQQEQESAAARLSQVTRLLCGSPSQSL
uniref:Signal-induced proliferation-associated 1 n=1 Tax=Chelonoidis abingdonii TaxID=106734 RepID=A0A8C0J9Y6_CHEAB